MKLKEAKKLKNNVLRIFNEIDPLIKEKFKNVCGKTGQYKVPDALFQDRTARTSRVLLPFKSIMDNSDILISRLKDFSGGVCVEFVNDDYFNEEFRKTKEFGEITKRKFDSAKRKKNAQGQNAKRKIFVKENCVMCI